MIFKKKKSNLQKAEEHAESKNRIDALEKEAEEEKNSNVQEISYVRASFWKRCSIIVFDFFCCAIITIGIFILSRDIIYKHTSMADANEYLHEQQLLSGLYAKSGNKYVDIIKYTEGSDQSAEERYRYVEKQLNTYFNYIEDVCGPEERAIIEKKYEESKLYPDVKKNGVAIFVKDSEGKTIINPDETIKISDVTNIFYKPFFRNVLCGHFQAKVPHIFEITQRKGILLLACQVPLSLFIGFTIIYYIVPLCFYRNKQTLGRFLFKTALVDKNVLSVKFGRFTARYAIMFFGEVLLSVVTLGIPIFVSFSLMAFSKKKQNFHDYMLGIEEVDVTCDEVFASMDELVIKQTDYDLDKFQTGNDLDHK